MQIPRFMTADWYTYIAEYGLPEDMPEPEVSLEELMYGEPA